MIFKEYKIDLGGNFPAKSEAVQRHAFKLGYKWGFSNRSVQLCDKQFLHFDQKSKITYNLCSRNIFLDQKEKQITAERFLELTKEDVQLKEKPELEQRLDRLSKEIEELKETVFRGELK